MPIPESTLARWSHHRSGTASIRAHESIRAALSAYDWPSELDYETFLQGSYKNHTNLRRDSDVDVVVRLKSKLRPRVAALAGEQLERSVPLNTAYERWRSFRRHALNAMRGRFGDDVSAGRKAFRIANNEIQTDADLVVTLSYKEGIGFYVPSEKRWIVSYPQQHHRRGLNKEQTTNNRFKRAIRMFKAARNRAVEDGLIGRRVAPSYFIECLLFNVPDELFSRRLVPTYIGIVDWLDTAILENFQCQNGQLSLFGNQKEQWTLAKSRAFVASMQRFWEMQG